MNHIRSSMSFGCVANVTNFHLFFFCEFVFAKRIALTCSSFIWMHYNDLIFKRELALRMVIKC